MEGMWDGEGQRLRERGREKAWDGGRCEWRVSCRDLTFPFCPTLLSDGTLHTRLSYALLNHRFFVPPALTSRSLLHQALPKRKTISSALFTPLSGSSLSSSLTWSISITGSLKNSRCLPLLLELTLIADKPKTLQGRIKELLVRFDKTTTFSGDML